jgi:hypothetical protein
MGDLWRICNPVMQKWRKLAFSLNCKVTTGSELKTGSTLPCYAGWLKDRSLSCLKCYVRTAIADSVGEEVKRKIRNMADRFVVLSDEL